MASRTYTETVIVLKKTKLKESDLILTLLAEDGRQIRAVAKGARKPTSSFASRLELFSHAEVLLVSGRSMDIVKEAKLVASHSSIRGNDLLATEAAVVSELLVRTTAAGLDNPRLFPMFDSFLDYLVQPSITEEASLLLCAGCLMKIIAQLGFRPCLDGCVECGTSVEDVVSQFDGGAIPFSYDEGGVLCIQCRELYSSYLVQSNTLSWLNSLIMQRFCDISSLSADKATLHELFDFCGTWIRTQLGFSQKSIEYLIATCL